MSLGSSSANRVAVGVDVVCHLEVVMRAVLRRPDDYPGRTVSTESSLKVARKRRCEPIIGTAFQE